MPKYSTEKKYTHSNLPLGCVQFSCGGEEGIRTLVGLPPNGFQDRLVMTASIPLRIVKKCVAVFVRLAKWSRFAAFGRQPEMCLRNLYGIMPAACGLPACGRLLTCRFSIANAARFVKISGDTKTESRGTPRLSVEKVFGNSGGNYLPPGALSLIPTRQLPAACRSRRRGSCRRGALPPRCGGQCSRVRPRGNPHRGRRTAPS